MGGARQVKVRLPSLMGLPLSATLGQDRGSDGLWDTGHGASPGPVLAEAVEQRADLRRLHEPAHQRGVAVSLVPGPSLQQERVVELRRLNTHCSGRISGGYILCPFRASNEYTNVKMSQSWRITGVNCSK